MLLSPVLGMEEDGHNTTNQGPRHPSGARNVGARGVTDTSKTNPVHDVTPTGEGSSLADIQRKGQPLLVQSFNLEFTKSVFVATVSICIGSIMHLNRSLLVVRCVLLQLLFFFNTSSRRRCY